VEDPTVLGRDQRWSWLKDAQRPRSAIQVDVESRKTRGHAAKLVQDGTAQWLALGKNGSVDNGPCEPKLEQLAQVGSQRPFPLTDGFC
jgi:hypothetical protein